MFDFYIIKVIYRRFVVVNIYVVIKNVNCVMVLEISGWFLVGLGEIYVCDVGFGYYLIY